MKRVLALALALVLACGLSAEADGLPYLRQQPQDTFVFQSLLTPESCPRVCLALYPASSMFAFGAAEPWYIAFDKPADAEAVEFDETHCVLIDEARRAQYHYEALYNYSFESFLSRCTDADNIVLSADGTRAAYIDPDRLQAYALIAVPEIDQSAKLYLSVYLGGVGKNVAAGALTEAIRAEVDRVQAGMSAALMEKHWTDGAFAGAKLLAPQLGDCLLEFDTPTLTLQTDGGALTAPMIVTGVDYNTLQGLFIFGDQLAIEVEIELSNYSYAFSMKDSSPQDSAVLTVGDREWTMYLSGLSSGSAYRGEASARLSEGDDYLSVSLMSAGYGGIEWTSAADFAGDLADIVLGMKIIALEDDPYVPAAAAEPEPAVGAASEPMAETVPEIAQDGGGSQKADESLASAHGLLSFIASQANDGADGGSGAWVCTSCQTKNTGNFCTNCGAKKP